MRLSFHIQYQTQWGQRLKVVGSLPQLGSNDLSSAPYLNYQADGHWSLSLDILTEATTCAYQYYLVDDADNILNQEWGTPRSLQLDGQSETVLHLKDNWRSRQHADNALETSAFEEAIFKRDRSAAPANQLDANTPFLKMQIRCPRVQAGEQICLSGSAPELGSWDLSKAILLSNEQSTIWSVTIPLPQAQTIEYKYGIYNTQSGRIKLLESGSNRVLPKEQFPAAGESLILTDEYFMHPMGPWKGAGVAIPVFSLRSQRGLGVGEFPDIQGLVDWASQLGLKMVQILPINDTTATKTWVDSYPYAAISTFALHPLYLNLNQLEGFDKAVNQKQFDRARLQLNQLDKVDYEQVMRLKLKYSRAIFNQEKEGFLKSTIFKDFLKKSAHWLKPYALFCYLRDLHGTVDFNQWGDNAKFTKQRLRKATSSKAAHFDEIAFWYYLQFQLDLQLRTATAYARQHGIVLKGDIPIGIYRYSMDAWMEPRLYNMDGQAGAPPDPFSATGQNWGFPTYNWTEMAKDNYQWWQNRLKQLSDYFDAFRIDHILGFFRIWQIPFGQVEGTMGTFNPALPITPKDFYKWNIAFDQERYCQPFISDTILEQAFKKESTYVKKTFLSKKSPGHWSFKPAFDTQQKIEQHFEKKSRQKKAHLKKGLFDLISNVLFFETPNGTAQSFHPRIDCLKTSSFAALEPTQQAALRDLYNDYFYHRQEDFWREQAMTKLPVIKNATNMLICGEDLGMVPDCVPGVMQELGFLTLEIQRMSKNPQTEFLQSKDIPVLSVASPSTHDMSPVRAWWSEMEVMQRQRFYQLELGLSGLAPTECSGEIAQRIINQHLHWPSMWTVFPIQDLLAIDEGLRQADPEEERINVPANPKHYWRYRFHLNLEELLEAKGLNECLRGMLERAGRA